MNASLVATRTYSPLANGRKIKPGFSTTAFRRQNDEPVGDRSLGTARNAVTFQPQRTRSVKRIPNRHAGTRRVERRRGLTTTQFESAAGPGHVRPACHPPSRPGSCSAAVTGPPQQATNLQPIMPTAVHLQQHAFLFPPLAPRTVLGRPPPLRRRQSSFPQNPLNRGAAQYEALHLGHFLVQVRVVEAGILASCQFLDLLTSLTGKRIMGIAALIAVINPTGVLGVVYALQPLNLSLAQV
jgi:hypothetical protein